MSLLQIRIYPDPVLRVECPPVGEVDEGLGKVIDDMVETMHAAPGVGLAAPQVGLELRLAVVDLSVGEDPEQLLVMVNPEIVARQGSASEVEGCLSIPDLSEKVVRPERITLRALDRAGQEYSLEADGWLARAILHEIDHLDGVLFTDHLRGLRKEKAKRALKRLKKEWDRATVTA